MLSLSLAALIIAILGPATSANAQSQNKYWIEFRDKGIDSACFHPGEPEFERTKVMLSKECLRRRSREMGTSELQTITLSDAPVSVSYLNTLTELGVKTQVVSRWSNAVSACLSPSQAVRVQSLPFVVRIGPVARAEILSMEPLGTVASAAPVLHHAAMPLSDTICGIDSIIFHYGHAQSQLDRINVPPLHAMGIDATGVRLGFLDTGFRWRVVSSLQTRHILSEYDYVFHDSVTANEAVDDPKQDNHGTSTFSTAMGYEPDSLIGPAYNASVYLAKTEDIRSERNIEEDNYAAALEDMEAAGVDVTTSSVGYFTFDSAQHSYTYPDLNGHTSICARAVEHAAKLGVLVVTAMGNSGANAAAPHLITPADADSIISVGALAPDNAIADFSSRGPTGDGRMKPEICAPGVAVWVQDVSGGYGPANGTSFATPLVSSACCLICQAHPEATALQIRRAIMRTGDNAKHPDTALGWGRMNAYAAALQLGAIIHIKRVTLVGSTVQFCVALADSSGIKTALVQYHTSQDFSTRSAPLALVADSLIYSGDLAVKPGQTLYYQILAISKTGTHTLRPMSYDSVVVPAQQLVQDAPEHSDLAVSIRYQSSEVILLTANLPITWRLFDPTGRELQSASNQLATSFSTINTQSLASGVYYLRATTTDGQAAVRPVAVIH